MSRRSVPTPVIEGAIFLLFFALLIPAGVVGWVIGHSGKKTGPGGTSVTSTTTAAAVSAPVASGAHIFVQFACAQCHGPQGGGGVSPDVPALTNVAQTLTPAQLRQIIDHGLGRRRTRRSRTCPSGAR